MAAAGPSCASSCHSLSTEELLHSTVADPFCVHLTAGPTRLGSRLRHCCVALWAGGFCQQALWAVMHSLQHHEASSIQLQTDWLGQANRFPCAAKIVSGRTIWTCPQAPRAAPLVPSMVVQDTTRGCDQGQRVACWRAKQQRVRAALKCMVSKLCQLNTLHHQAVTPYDAGHSSWSTSSCQCNIRHQQRLPNGSFSRLPRLLIIFQVSLQAPAMQGRKSAATAEPQGAAIS